MMPHTAISLSALQNHCKVAFKLQQSEGKGGRHCTSERMERASVPAEARLHVIHTQKPGSSLRLLHVNIYSEVLCSFGGDDQ